MGYRQNKERARYTTVAPTLTDQAAARDTDLTVIVNSFLKTGQAPGNPGEPMYDDFTELPTDLRGFIESARTVKRIQASLPEPIRGLDPAELLALSPQQLKSLLEPKAPDQLAKPLNQGNPEGTK